MHAVSLFFSDLPRGVKASESRAVNPPDEENEGASPRKISSVSAGVNNSYISTIGLTNRALKDHCSLLCSGKRINEGNKYWLQ